MIRSETPKFTGITVHRDPRGRFAIRYPTDWHCYEIGADQPTPADAPQGSADAPQGSAVAPADAVAPQEGIGFAPVDGDPFTVFTAWASPLEEGVVAEDLDVLKEGVEAGLAGLEDCQVEAASEMVLGNLLRFERIYCYRDRTGDGHRAGHAGVVRKRKQWLLYVDTWLICLTWQGANVEEYEYWLAMANQSFLTFQIPEALWFFTDRELLAQAHDPARTRSSTA